MRNVLLLGTALALTATVGCSADGTVCPAGISGAVPILTVGPVVNTQTNTTVDSFTVNNVRLDGTPLPGGTQIVCHGTCGFGTEAGTYTFTVSASAIRDTTVTVEASYTTSNINVQHGNSCGVDAFRQGTTIEILQ